MIYLIFSVQLSLKLGEINVICRILKILNYIRHLNAQQFPSTFLVFNYDISATMTKPPWTFSRWEFSAMQWSNSSSCRYTGWDFSLCATSSCLSAIFFFFLFFLLLFLLYLLSWLLIMQIVQALPILSILQLLYSIRE